MISLIIFSIILIISISDKSSAIDYYSISPGSTQEVDEHGTCKDVTNGGSYTVYVPTKISDEWSSFRSNPPPSVTFAACYTPPDTGGCNPCCCYAINGAEISYPSNSCSSISNVFQCSPDESCFHPESIIELEDGTKKMVKEIEYGDKVKSTDEKGNIIYSEVLKDLYFNMREDEGVFPYVVIKAGENTLRVTLLHNIFVGNLRKNLNAYKIKQGMYINVLEGDEIVLREVESVNFENLKGKYDIYTENGKVIVDNIVAGTLEFYPQERALFWWKYFNKHPKQYLRGYKVVYAPAFKKAYRKALEEIKEELETINPEIGQFN